MNSLPSGVYVITSVATDTPVGRNLVEDHSLNPKRVVSLPPGQENPLFHLEVQSDGVIIKVNGAPTVTIDRNLFAALIDEPPAEEWKINRAEGNGDDIYTIETKNRDAGWVLVEQEPETQVSVRPLIVFPTYPPRFPPNELWKIVRVSDE